jgi:hypothetical protein
MHNKMEKSFVCAMQPTPLFFFNKIREGEEGLTIERF